MKIQKKIIIPVVSALIVAGLVFALVAFSGKEETPASAPVSTSPEITNTTTPHTTATTTSPKSDNTLKLSFIGDCILGVDPVSYSEGSFIWYSENYPLSYFFEKVKPQLENDDFTISNMECVLSDNLSLKAIDKGYTPAFWFRAKAKNAEILTEGSVEIASVVNNHTDDYGDEGYADTIKSLEAAGLLVGEDCKPIYFEKNGIKVGLVCANLWGYWQVSYIEDALKDMQDKCDYKVVFFHGGEEGYHMPDNFKIDACRDLANSGLCDLIVGAHPHVLQPFEIVNNVPIMYSVGNFCFAGNNYPENKTVIFKANLTKNDDGSIKTETEVIPCYVYTGDCNNWQPAIVTDEADKADIMAMINTPVDYWTPTEPSSTAPSSTADVSEEETEVPEEEYVPEYTEEYEEEYPDEYIPETEEIIDYPDEEYTDEYIEDSEDYEDYEDFESPEDEPYYEDEVHTEISYY